MLPPDSDSDHAALLAKFDFLFRTTVAVTSTERLVPASGVMGVIFASTYAATTDGKFSGGYNVDTMPDGRNYVLIDSVGSQFNRLEPMFMEEPYADLVPQITAWVEAPYNENVNLLVVAHRAADAFFKNVPETYEILQGAAVRLSRGDAVALAKIAPTSFVGGVWFSRDLHVKAPRIYCSEIRAFDADVLTRGAVYTPPIQYVRGDGFVTPHVDAKELEAQSACGFQPALASNTHGGIVARGGIERTSEIRIGALLRLFSKVSDGTLKGKDAPDAEGTLALRRYLLGLCLVLMTSDRGLGTLRSGCTLVRDGKRTYTTVSIENERLALDLTPEIALEYARATAAAFGVGPDRQADFKGSLPQIAVDTERKGKKKVAEREAADKAGKAEAESGETS